MCAGATLTRGGYEATINDPVRNQSGMAKAKASNQVKPCAEPEPPVNRIQCMKRGAMTDGMEKLPRTFYDRDADIVARELLGQYLVRKDVGKVRIGRIVETEAYLGPHDLAAHSARGKTARTEVMFGPPGYAYVYMIYGMHHCLNVVTGAKGAAAAVLLRALEPVEGIEQRTSGPGLLCRALGIDRGLNGHDLQIGDFTIAARRSLEPFEIVERPRIGVHYAGEWSEKPLRFYIKGNPFVSRK
jgi:DNA-3-methyladenine glycosylase